MIGDVEKLAAILVRNRTKKSPEVARIVGVKPYVIKYWETGNRFPREEQLPLVSLAYGIRPEELFQAWRESTEARKQEVLARRSATSFKPARLPWWEIAGPSPSGGGRRHARRRVCP